MQRCAITDGTAGSRPGWLLHRCVELARQQVDLLLVREHALTPADLVTLTRRIVTEVAAVAPTTRVLLAAPPRLALAAGAAGVHLSAQPGQPTPAQVRAVFPEAYITQSCHILEEVRRARDGGSTAILFGPVFGKWVGGAEVVHGIGLDRLAEAVAEAGSLPVFALGGIMESNAESCVATGATGIAAIRMFFA